MLPTWFLAVLAIAALAWAVGQLPAAEHVASTLFDDWRQRRGLFDVVLLSHGATRIPVIKVIRETTGASLMEAKEATEGLPKVLMEGVTRDKADAFARDLRSVGATVQVRGL